MSKLVTFAQISCGLLLGFLACMAMPTASASTVPGNICNTRDDVEPWGPYMLANTDGSVLCALPRSLNSGSLNAAFARVHHPAGAANDTVCYLYAKNSLNTAQSSKVVITSTAGAQSLDFGANTLTTYSGGYYYVGCNLQAGGQMIGVRYDEI